MALSRLYTFVAGQTILASEVNAEFNQLINFLNGTVLADATMKNSNAGTPTLTLDHTGGGKPLSVKVGGSAAVEVNALRQLVLTPVAGNAPMTVTAGLPKVDNLDADKLDGVEGAGFLRSDTQLSWKEHATSTAVGLKITGDSFGWAFSAMNEDRAFFERLAAGATEPSGVGNMWFEFDGVGGRINTAPLRHFSTPTPTDALDVPHKGYVDAKTSDWAFGAFYDGQVSTATVQPMYISPSTGKITLNKLRIVHRSGTPTGNTVVKLARYSSTSVLIQEWTITLPQAQSAGHVVTANVATNNVLNENDTLRWFVTTAGAHADVSVFVTGTEGLL